MEIETTAKKLEPLMPGKVKHWLDIRQFADPQMKQLIDMQIVRTAREKLPDIESQILLPPPPRDKCRGPVHLGKVFYEKDRWDFGLNPSELMQGVTIFGRSGSGKTNLMFQMLRHFNQHHVTFIFFDWKRVGRQALGLFKGKVNVYTPGRSLSPLPFNPFIAPPGLEYHLYVTLVVDTLSQAFTLGDGSRSLLQKALIQLHEKKNHSPTISQVIDQVNALADQSRSRQWAVSAIRALESLHFSDLGGAGQSTQDQQIQKLLKENTIIELNGLGTNEKTFLVVTISLWIYYTRMIVQTREKLETVLCIDEAHNILYRRSGRVSETLMESLLRQFRELGMGIILADQNCHLTSAPAIGNSLVSVFLNQKDPKDQSLAASICGLEGSDRSYLNRLSTGEAIVKLQERWKLPFALRIPLVSIAKGAMNDSKLRQYLDQKHPHSANCGAEKVTREAFGQFPVAVQPMLGQHALALVHDVVKHPTDGVFVRYKRLGFGGRKGNRIKQQLIAQGYLESQTIRHGLTHKQILRLSKRCQTELKIQSNATKQESIEHGYWKHWYAKWYADQGCQVQIEALRVGGKVDVLAVKTGKRIGIEIETGKSDVVKNVTNGLKSKFDQIIVVGTSDGIVAKLKRQLEAKSLLIDGRVDVRLAGNIK